MESIHAQPLVRHRLLNDCHVVDNGTSTFDTVVVMAATARLYPELKSNSGKHLVALPSFPSNRSPAGPVCQQDTIQDLESQ